MNTLVEMPPLLAVTSAPPRKLRFIGDASCLTQSCVAIVGSRRASPYGLRIAYQLGRELAMHGVCIVSGLARGIDGAAHAGALAGLGRTIAVLGHGLNRIYPAEHRNLAVKIQKNGGALVSEYDDTMPPLPENFPRRNRIIAGLSWVTIVIEAHEKSGSLITAGFAADEGREVFVVPSRLGEQAFSGSYRLIREGARIFTEIDEILNELPGIIPVVAAPLAQKTDALGAFFLERGGVAQLSEIRAEKRLEERFQSALATGEVIENRFQEFLWVGAAKGSV